MAKNEMSASSDKQSLLRTISVSDNVVSLWVKEVIRVSSEYDPSRWCGQCVVGAPRVYPDYGDKPGAWAQGVMDANQFIEVKYAKKLFIRDIDIYETLNAGAVVKISALDSAGDWVTLWQTPTPSVIQSSRIFSPSIKTTDFPADSVRLDVDCTAAGTWCEIDAIQIKGFTHLIPPPPSLHTLAEDLNGLVNNPLFSDVQFEVDNGHVVYGHRAILVTRSQYFRAMLCAGLKEGNGTTESVSRTISIQGVSYDSFLAMIQYLYTNSLQKSVPVLNLVELIRVGDRFSLDGLRAMSHCCLCNDLTVENVIDVYRESLDILPQLEDVQEVCLRFIGQNLSKVCQTPPFASLPQHLLVEIIQRTTEYLTI